MEEERPLRRYLQRVRLQEDSSGTATTGPCPTTSTSARSTIRPDLLEAKGIKPPTNWDEFQAAAIALNDPGEQRLRRRLSGRQLPHRAALLHVVHVPGRRQHPRQGRQPDLRHRPRKDANVKALTYLTDLATKYKVTPPGIASYNTDDPHTLYAAGPRRVRLRHRRGHRPAHEGKPGAVRQDRHPRSARRTGRSGAASSRRRSTTRCSSGNTARPRTRPRRSSAGSSQPGRLERALPGGRPGQHWPIFKSRHRHRSREEQPPADARRSQNVVPYTTDFAYPGFGRPGDGHYRRREDVRWHRSTRSSSAPRRPSRRCSTPHAGHEESLRLLTASSGVAGFARRRRRPFPPESDPMFRTAARPLRRTS